MSKASLFAAFTCSEALWRSRIIKKIKYSSEKKKKKPRSRPSVNLNELSGIKCFNTHTLVLNKLTSRAVTTPGNTQCMRECGVIHGQQH